MSFIAFLILGILAGIIARLIIPGRQRGGWLLTIILGIVGAMLGGWIAGFFSADVYTSFFSLWGWIAAIVGALIVTLIFNAIFNGRRRVA
ncbi:MAG TPA: GlsB/YeaQ/YmgE family stress response membrane protein [Pseudolysinimonas sp.]